MLENGGEMLNFIQDFVSLKFCPLDNVIEPYSEGYCAN